MFLLLFVFITYPFSDCILKCFCCLSLTCITVIVVQLLLLLLSAVEEATVAYRQWQSSRTNRCDEPRDDRKPPPYKRVKASITIVLCFVSFVLQLCHVFVVMCLWNWCKSNGNCHQIAEIQGPQYLENERTNQPLLFRDWISNCTNLFWPKPNRTETNME